MNASYSNSFRSSHSSRSSSVASNGPSRLKSTSCCGVATEAIGSIWRKPRRRTVSRTLRAEPSSSCARTAIRLACSGLTLRTARPWPVVVGARDLIERVDQTLGDQVERVMVAHHRRRLQRLGQLGALDAPAGGWAAGNPPPREGNSLQVLVDGSEALPAIARAISDARERVWLAGWHFTPELRVGEISLRELLAEAAERVEVNVLAWAGAPLPLFHPDRKEVREGRERLVAGTRIQCVLDDRERPMHCHHEKLVIVDGRIAFVGGIDLTTLGGNRLDAPSHPARGSVGWHDAAARVEGPAAVDVADHFALRWAEVTGEKLQ